MPEDQSFLVDYVYGPYVGRMRIEGPTLAVAREKLWVTLGKELWVAKRFRTLEEVKEENSGHKRSL